MSTLFPVLGWVFTDTRNLFASDLILNFTNFIMSLYVKVEKTSYIAFKQQMWHSLRDYVCLCVYMLLLVHRVLVQSVGYLWQCLFQVGGHVLISVLHWHLLATCLNGQCHSYACGGVGLVRGVCFYLTLGVNIHSNSEVTIVSVPLAINQSIQDNSILSQPTAKPIQRTHSEPLLHSIGVHYML